MEAINKLFCLLGLHVWLQGRGYIDLGDGVSAYYDGKRCSYCGKCKDAPSINKHLSNW